MVARTTPGSGRFVAELALATAAQLGALALLNACGALGARGAVAGCGYAAGLALLLWRTARTAPWGSADRVTLVRAVLVGAVTAQAVQATAGPIPAGVFLGLVVPALVLDGVDGQVARRRNCVSAFGARFDMELDAFLVLVLSGYVALDLGAWVLGIGALRYAFVLAGRALPWMRAALPPSRRRKAVAAAQGVLLVIAAAPVVPAPAAHGAALLALVSLLWSFGADTWWLWRRSRAGTRERRRAGSAM
ncbi:CDP-alcohol phosphatidyltransferase family protein [Salinifilum ghardaiensis]